MTNTKKAQKYSISTSKDKKQALKIAMQMPKSRIDTVSGRLGN